MRRWVWHEDGLPIEGLPVVVRTNMVSYHMGTYNKGWWIRTGRRYSEAEKVITGSERITGWAYVGGEE